MGGGPGNIKGGISSCTLTSLLLGVDVKALITGSCLTLFRWVVVLAPPKRTLISAETLVSNALS